MFLPFILFVSLTVATAVIAYWSDNLGKKLGKKRVSLFGLRPRTTATVLTISSSWGIMLFTLVFLLAAVAPLRNALFHYERDRAQYQQDIGVAKEQLAGTQTRLTEKQNSLTATQGQLEKVQTSLNKANEDARKANENALKARNYAAKAVNEGKKRVEEAQKRFVSAQAKFVEAQKRAAQAQRQEGVARQGEKQAENLENQARSQLSQARSNLQSTNVRLKGAQQSLSLAESSLSKATDLVFKNSKEVFALENQRKHLLKQIDQLGQELNNYQNVTALLGGGKIEIPVGRTFAAGIIESGKSQKRIEENLRQLLMRARETFPSIDTAQGAQLELLPLPVKVNGKDVLIEGDEIFERLAALIAKNEDATSVRLVAARNFTAGETLIDARFIAVPVATAFHADEELAAGVIDGNSGDAGVFNKLLALTDAGREIAVQRKVNPPQSPQEPNFYAAGTNVALFAAMRRIEATGRLVKVRLVAADDLLTVEPLRVRFEIDGEEAGN